jgi:hypothetical protein
MPLRTSRGPFLLATLAIALGAGNGVSAEWASTQAGTAWHQDVYTISDNVNLVLLDVSVKDPRGGYISDLSRNAFHVFEDGHVQKITQFGSVDSPVTVGLVVDESGSMRSKRAQVVLAGLAFAKESNRQDEFFVVNFNNRVVRGLPDGIAFTDDLGSRRVKQRFMTRSRTH